MSTQVNGLEYGRIYDFNIIRSREVKLGERGKKYATLLLQKKGLSK